MIVSTGCFGYVTDRTFTTLLSHMSGSTPPIIATFVMEPFAFTEAAATLDGFGYRTREFTTKKFRQRRYFDSTERSRLHRQKNGPNSTEAESSDEDYIYAKLYVSEHRSASPTKLFSLL